MGLAQAGGAHHQCAETRAIDIVDLRKVEDQVVAAGIVQLFDLVAERARLGAQRDAAFQIEDDNAFVFPLFDVESHGLRLYYGYHFRGGGGKGPAPSKERLAGESAALAGRGPAHLTPDTAADPRS